MVSTRNSKKKEAEKVASSPLKKYTLDELRQHKNADSLWVAVKGKVYDVTDFVPKHPGGKYVLQMSGGQDITYLMETSHPFVTTPWKILESYLIGEVESFVTYNEDEPFWTEMKQKAKQYFEETGKDPKYALPSFLVFLGFLALYFVSFYLFCTGSLLAAIVFGASRSLFGIHTMHACSHYAITHKPWVWKWGDWFVFDILMGSSHWAWDYQHVIGHHQHTNVFQADPDLPSEVEGDIRRVVPYQVGKFMYKFQAFYLPFLYTLLVFKVRFFDLQILLGLTKNGPIEMNQTPKNYILFVFTKMFFIFYQFYIPLVVFDMEIYHFLKLYVAMELMSGAWLAYFFQVNHISENVLYTGRFDPKSVAAKEWAALQIEGSVDYGHDSFKWLHMLVSGTLNYQTVHHLFPSVAPHHYPAIAVMVKDLCKKYNVKYQHHSNYFVAAYYHLKETHRMGQIGIPCHID